MEHVKTEHNMWQYLWFTIYMESKDPLTYTGPEQYVYENLIDKNGFVRLGPIKKSLSIDRKAGKVKEEFTNKVIMGEIGRLKKLVEKILKDSSELRSSRPPPAK